MSRSFGDFIYKQNKALSPIAQPVSCEPDIRVIARDPLDNDLIFACDGIWDVFQPDELILVMNELLVGAAERLDGRRATRRRRRRAAGCWTFVWSATARTT